MYACVGERQVKGRFPLDEERRRDTRLLASKTDKNAGGFVGLSSPEIRNGLFYADEGDDAQEIGRGDVLSA